MVTDPPPAGGASTQPHPYARVAVIGGGAWGTALAAVARRAGREVRLWGRDAAVCAAIAGGGRNDKYLPGIALPAGIAATDDLGRALDGAQAVLLVTPSATVREMCARLRPHLPARVPIALCAKGIEVHTGLLLAQVVTEELPGHPVGALSGPSFAHEAAKGFPTAVTVAFPFTYEDRLKPRAATAVRLAYTLSSPVFRPYISDDLTGVEVGGAVKNVIAIACGMMTGAGFAENTRAALITRGINEMKTLAQALGGRRETVTGLSGAGDLTLTCSSQTSRNMSLGVQLGQGLARAECFDGRPVVVEGEVNAVSVIDLARRIGVRMPICEAVHAVLHDGAPLRETFARLWSSPLEAEPNMLDIYIDHPADLSAIPDFAGETR
ncbi:NAD(P)H-dependent glycerol-3-phosphate dehydrogenase [Rhodobacteraceae bacterium 2CG4]|uniref:Glycerol-3-phosphate dehydrogenase [NAD(P)+] n=1 Tax=Halovulum marinum TaxID=2662447 RepID=A0A6L5Z4I9_9RHOB|nr:NAD(P)H-dependent glycerol-3-phosphate dehydrogenase [Halovulum marinum]MSU91010.1 NAD(P)H-dependent glycerol-3-phosphate dehydrogenase [Halovulum marinum]